MTFRYAFASSVLLLSGLCLAGENVATVEGIVMEMLASMGRITEALASIQDEDSAKAVQPALEKEAKAWKALRQKAADVRPPNDAEKERLRKEYKGKLEEAQRKLFTEIARVQRVPGGKQALKDVSKVLTR